MPNSVIASVITNLRLIQSQPREPNASGAKFDISPRLSYYSAFFYVPEHRYMFAFVILSVILFGMVRYLYTILDWRRKL